MVVFCFDRKFGHNLIGSLNISEVTSAKNVHDLVASRKDGRSSFMFCRCAGKLVAGVGVNFCINFVQCKHFGGVN